MEPEAPPIRVLVVDDHAVVRRGLLAFLGSEPDLEVVGDVGGGEEALAALERLDAEDARPDVVLMDLKMEPVDGVEATRRIRDRYENVAVVVLTSFGEGRRVRAALDAGASGYLLKDADADEVAASLRAAHRGELQLDAAITRSLMAGPQTETSEAAAALTSRELEVLALVGAGKPNKTIAGELSITERTTRSHVSSILAKLGLSSRTQLALWAVRNGLASGGDAADDSRVVPA
jgi:DNA-binding NarL/FixJ family response regulator